MLTKLLRREERIKKSKRNASNQRKDQWNTLLPQHNIFIIFKKAKHVKVDYI